MIGEKVRPLNKEEKATIRTLERLADKWPASLWLYSASGKLHVMQYDENGNDPETEWGGTDNRYDVCVIDIPNDGGDW